MKKRPLINSLLLLVIFISLFSATRWQLPIFSQERFFERSEMDELSRDDILAERYWRMVDEKGNEIMVTGRRIYVGDEYLTSDNKLYRVHSVKGRTAYARLVREVGAVFDEGRRWLSVFLAPRAVPAQGEEEEGDDLAPEEAPQGIIGIYHTHNAESYVPTDGTDSIFGRGGIHEVGESFARALEEQGVTVIHDQTFHLPHDRGAYRRSRPTALGILEQGPDVIFDVHRDATPRHVYATEIEGEPVTQVQFVVGRQNPNMAANRQFALDLKNTADEVHPGLIKGIFMARGHYNQDLTPINLLLEVGAHTNPRGEAEDGIALFADVITFYFYGPPEERAPEDPLVQLRPAPPGAQTAPGNRAAIINILLLLGFTAVVAFGFLLLNTGRFSDLKRIIAPYVDKITAPFHRADKYLDPVRNKIYDNTERIRVFLEPAMQKVDLFFAAAGRLIVAGVKKSDIYLAGLAEKIFNTAAQLWAKIVPVLESGDDIAASWRAGIRELYLAIRDRITELWQKTRNRRKT